MNPKRKAAIELRQQREMQIAQRMAQLKENAVRRVEVLHVAVHDGLGGKFTCGDVVTETDENKPAIEMWLAKNWARLT